MTPALSTLRPIPGYDQYFVNAAGEIVSTARGAARVLRTWRNKKSGFLEIRLKDRTQRIHRLVCKAWHGAPPAENAEVRHVNGDRADNRPANLRWGGTTNRRQRSGNRLTAAQAIEIFGARGSQTEIATRYGVSQVTVSYIKRRKIWRQVTADLPDPPRHRRAARPVKGSPAAFIELDRRIEALEARLAINGSR